ncbi:MAG: AAA family ATPase [Burkholderiaceae bacterium]|nr:AAA family ATPase [Sulfuritalea sp.]MCF8175707.1 AAA family ATPase [Burkholderiaceae bacterium]
MSAALPTLIQALLDPRCYAHVAERVELVETHASWLLLAGEFAYKIKKSITLPFLDYGSLEQRENFCRAELRLNRRLAADLYLDVLPIGGTPERPRLGETPAIEWAVRMRRFDERGRLDHLAARGELQPAHLTRLAATLCAFQQAAAVAAPDTRFGAPQQVLAAARENFVELRQILPPEDQPQVEALARWTDEEFAHRAADFAARKSGGFVREGHGDLHLGNLVLIDGRVVPFDCIEFNEDFRWNDPASEIAFVWIDLLDHGRPGLAAWFLNAWLEQGGDFQALAVLRFYAVYRAVVRAKVAALRARQEDPKPGAAELDVAREYLRLGQRIAVPPAPTFTLTCGLSGSGKTTASSARLLDPALAEAGSMVRLRSDVERKRLFGLAPHANSGSRPDDGIYTAEATTQTYARLRALARGLLDAGWSVIVDAAFLRREERVDFRALAAERGAGFQILLTEAPMDVLRQRIITRQGDASEATLAVLEKQQVWFEALVGDEKKFVIGHEPKG